MEKRIKNFTLVEAKGGGHMFYFKDEVYRNRVYDYFESYLKMSKKGQNEQKKGQNEQKKVKMNK